MPEAWLRGPLAGVPAELMPAAHALTDAAEEIHGSLTGLPPEALWARPGGAASLGFHVQHVARSLDRLLTYARGDGLSDAQRARLAAEGEPGDPPDDAEQLLAELDAAVARAIDEYRATPPHTLGDARKVGRAGLPSSVRGLLFHAAEHARRHAGQVIATARIVRGLGLALPVVSDSSALDLAIDRAAYRVRVAGPGDRDELVRLRCSLWPDSTADEVDDLLAAPGTPPLFLVADRGDGTLAGFAEIGARAYAEGCGAGPVAYLEGIWVDPDHRRQGVASALVQGLESWARHQGLREMASDALPENEGSLAFHAAVGFEVVEHVVCFRRAVGAERSEA